MSHQVHFVSYWENAPGSSVPPYIALALAWTRRVLGNAFQLLTPRNLTEAIGGEYLHKRWGFRSLDFDAPASAVAIVAKSDYIRLAYVLRHGGVWLDADTILMSHPCPAVLPNMLDTSLYWYSEALFGAGPGNALLHTAARKCLEAACQDWGDPGAIRSEIAKSKNAVIHIPQHHFDPGYRPTYVFKTCDVMFDRAIPVELFLSNSNLKVLKLYNTYFSRSSMGTMTINEFLESGFLLARIFLHLVPDHAFWVKQGLAVVEEIG